MNYLLDTSAFLLYVTAQRNLSAQARTIIGDSDNGIYLSLVSIWELAVKFRIGKLEFLPSSFSEWLDRQLAANSFRILEIKLLHLKRVATLPLVHRDPFDRLIIAQSQVEGLPVISNDVAFDKYPIQGVW